MTKYLQWGMEQLALTAFSMHLLKQMWASLEIYNKEI
jgi:hypothetical protein